MKIAQAFNIKSRYLRSAHLERDFHDPSALDGYIVTREIQRCVDRISDGLDNRSGQRAWRITGDYGSGKSSFALLLAHLFAGRDSNLPSQLKKSLDLVKFRKSKPQLIPVLITGSREPLGVAIARALYKALDESIDKRARLQCLSAIEEALQNKSVKVSDAEVVDLIKLANRELVSKERATGLLIILDELGKFLEFAALHPERQDIFLLQQLAELSSRSGREQIFTLGLLHQGFNAYSDQLSQSSQREWEKVAGRFEELLFDQPLDQITHLVAHALDVKPNVTPRGWEFRSKHSMRAAIELGWYGSAPPITSLTEAASSIYPLHPSVIPVIVRLFSRFGQNERSLFSFLLSNEPHGLQAFAQNDLSVDNAFRIHHLYDYAAGNFGHKLSVQSYRNHWNHIDSLVRSFPAGKEVEVAILKTVGLLNLLNSEMLPTDAAIVEAVGDGSYEGREEVLAVIHHLYHDKKVLYFRGKKGGYCLWSHTSLNLEASYDDAVRALGSQKRVTELIQGRLDARPIVARRHYIKTGNLRHFEVVYCSLIQLEKAASSVPVAADGRIIIPLCESAEESQEAMHFASTFNSPKNVLIGITEPLGALAGLIQEVERWGFVEKHTPELKDDRYALEEVTRQLASATQTLEKRVQHYVGLREAAQSGGQMPIVWFAGAKRLKVESVSAFLSLLSDVCDEVYVDAPRVNNELINRRSLSSAAAAARMRLIERMLESRNLEYLGMDPANKPPEMSIYLSVLQQTKVHSKKSGSWTIGAPEVGDDVSHLSPALSRIKQLLEEKPDGRFSVEQIFNELRLPPFGVRDGILPLLLLIVILENQQEIAVYEDGTFKSQLLAPDFLRLTKSPGSFELQYCRIQGVRLNVFEKLADVLNVKTSGASKTEILDIVRPLCVFAAELPTYCKNTKRISEAAIKVRLSILEARDPGKLLFTDLPEACGFEPFSEKHHGKAQVSRTDKFVEKLRDCLEELKHALPSLQDRMCKEIHKAFGLSWINRASFSLTRDSLAERSERLLLNVTDLDLKAFCIRLLDNSMPEGDWLESMGSFAASTPPSRWKDSDELVFNEKLKAFAVKFLRVESVNFKDSRTANDKSAVKILITQRDGTEKEKVVYLSPKEETDAEEIEQQMKFLLQRNSRVALAALSRVAWSLLEEKRND